MKLSKPKDWGRILLPAFLLAILLQGVMYLPEVRVKFFPERLWQERLLLVAQGCDQVKGYLTRLEAELAAIDTPAEHGFQPVSKNNGQGRTGGVIQIAINAWHSMVAPTPQISFEKHYYQARKKAVHAEMKLHYLELMLDRLLLSTSYPNLDGIAYRGNHDTLLIHKQIHIFRQKCHNYEQDLKIREQLLQHISEYADKQTAISESSISTRN